MSISVGLSGLPRIKSRWHMVNLQQNVHLNPVLLICWHGIATVLLAQTVPPQYKCVMMNSIKCASCQVGLLIRLGVVHLALRSHSIKGYTSGQMIGHLMFFHAIAICLPIVLGLIANCTQLIGRQGLKATGSRWRFWVLAQ